MKCVNCGRELPPDTAECPFCLERDRQKSEFKNERHKIFFTLGICALVLALIAAGVLIFMPDSSFQRNMESAESSYAIAELCEGSPAEAGDERYQLRLISAVDDIEERYNNLTCGYNQTVTALRQIYSADNAVVRDHTERVWSNVERMRFYQLLNHKRTENGLSELVWDADTAAAAESIADEYSSSGMNYEENVERLIRTLLPDAGVISVSSLMNAVNAQDALVKYEEGNGEVSGNSILYSSDISVIGADAVYDAKSGMWSFFVLVQQ